MTKIGTVRPFRTTGSVVAVLLAVVAVLSVVGWYLLRSHSPLRVTDATWAVNAVNGPDVSGFARATEPRPIVFPEDHGPHPEYQTEWWYYTGNLRSADGRQWGYQLTFFRRGLTPDPVERESRWAASNIYMAHFALSDVAGQQFFAEDQLARDGEIGLAGASADPYHVFVKEWQATGTGDTARLQAATDQVGLDLDLRSLKPPTLQGNQGLSQKSGAEGNASYYYSLTRIATQGTITVGGETFEVEGLSWMDHEWSTSALDEQQLG